MSNLTHPLPESQDTDSAIVAMIDQMLADDNLHIGANMECYELYEWDGNPANNGKRIDLYDTRVAAYRAAIDCLIEACIDAWDKGGQE